MPKIQLIRRDSGVIELDATGITFSVNRNVEPHPVPVLATRAALDLNVATIGITIEGVLADDDRVSGAASAEMSIDLSLAFGIAGATSWVGSTAFATSGWSSVKSELDYVQITFQTKGQVDANVGEKNTILLRNGSGSNTVATESIIHVDISSTTNTNTLSTAITNALNAASIKVNTSTVTLASVCSISSSTGQSSNVSYYAQVGSSGQYTNELIKITNKETGSSGNVLTVVSKSTSASSVTWDNQFFVSNMRGGVTGTKMSKGDKLQDLLNMVMNASAGGALVSPRVLSGSLIDLPDSIASFDASSFLNLDTASSVKKYIIGVRIPYDSLVTATNGDTVLRQYLIPAGPGTDYSAEKNTFDYDPLENVNGEQVRPNPFLQQGVAIPAIIRTFDPSYEAGDSVWTYQMTLAPCEQLVGF